MTSGIPNAIANTEDFEFAALDEARNYREALIQEFNHALRGNVIEIGAGIGQMTGHLRELAHVSRLLSIEPDRVFASRFRIAHPEAELIDGTIDEAPAESSWDAIVSINVLEHIKDDEIELGKYAKLLGRGHGALCLLVPACPELYAPIDRDFGHFRRYTRPELRGKLVNAGFAIETLTYYNMVGYFAWWLNFCVLKKRDFELSKVRAFDRYIFPVFHNIEASVVRPPFGQSLLAIARA